MPLLGPRLGQRAHLARLARLTLCATLAFGCSRGADVALSKAEAEAPIPDVPVPPADGPLFLALADHTPIFERPSTSSRQLGELRLGAAVPRSSEPHSRKDCVGGWYVVRPRGFVCAPDPDEPPPLTAALPRGPRRERPLPYRYGRAKVEGVPIYTRLPSEEEQREAEPDLERWLSRLDRDVETLGPSANDVPFDAQGRPSGPPVLLPGGDGVDASSRRYAATYFHFGDDALPPLLLPGKLAGAAKGGTLRRGSGVAITASVLAVGELGARRFGVTPDGRYVPTDRLKPALGTPWHGVELGAEGLPVAFAHKAETPTYKLRKNEAIVTDETFERRSPIRLTGRFRTVDGDRYEETRDGVWVRAKDVIVVVKRSKFPEFVRDGQKWLDVGLGTQTLIAYEGRKPVFATLISSGREQLGDAAAGAAATPRGTFTLRGKHLARDVDSREVGSAHDVGDAPWVLDVADGFAITGNYWSDPLGEPHGFHDVALGPIDARHLFRWASPELPDGWSAVTADPNAPGGTTVVYVRP